MPIYKPTSTNIKKAASIIKAGGIAAFPTETVYGLGADAFNPSAAVKIFEAKKRPFFDPLIVHISAIDMLGRLIANASSLEMELAEKFWPGPLTIIFEKKKTVPDIITAGLPTVAVRIPANRIALDLINESDTAIAAPSANPFNYISPTTALHVEKQLGTEVEMILDGGECSVGLESTIIKTEGKKILILRQGGIEIDLLREFSDDIKIISAGSSVESPGQMEYHYSPATMVKIVDKITVDDYSNPGFGFLFFKTPICDYPNERSEVLSNAGDIKEAAANFFSALHTLDEKGLDLILAEKVPDSGLGSAIMDRLVKASKRHKGES